MILPSTQKAIYRMPSFAGLSEGDRADLVAYLVSLRARDPEAEPDAEGEGS